MTPYEVYQKFISLKQHFSSDTYDYFRYGGRTYATPESYEKRKDKVFFEKLSKHLDPTGVLIANFIDNPDIYIRNINIDKYNDWSKVFQSLSYNFAQDLKQMLPNFDDNFKFRDGQKYPYAVQLYLDKRISLETLVILINIVRCINFWNKELIDDPVWIILRRKLIKYSGFVEFDMDKYTKIMVNIFKERQEESHVDSYDDFFHFGT
jgi:hypothetical protein